MGFFDRFRKRVTKVAEDTDIDELTAEEDSVEGEEALAEKERIEAEALTTKETEDWEELEELDAIELSTEEDDEWEDWDEELPRTLAAWPEARKVCYLREEHRALVTSLSAQVRLLGNWCSAWSSATYVNVKKIEDNAGQPILPTLLEPEITVLLLKLPRYVSLYHQ